MSTNFAVLAPLREICPHLLEPSLDKPLALFSLRKVTKLACPSCIVDHFASMLSAGYDLVAITRSVSFKRCGHKMESRVACLTCLSAIKMELSTRCANTTPKSSAKRLQKVMNELSLSYDKKLAREGGSKAKTTETAGSEMALKARSAKERFKGLGSETEITAQFNKEWWSFPLTMRVLDVDKEMVGWLTRTVGVLTYEKINGINMVFRDDVLVYVDKSLEQVVAEAKGEHISNEVPNKHLLSKGLEDLQLTRSQWDFYFRRRLEERGFDAPIYTSCGIEARWVVSRILCKRLSSVGVLMVGHG